jgi:nucleotide-binding universal stress UspA family protein
MRAKLKILLATDYSEAASGAERYAVGLAKLTSGTISLLHVYDLPLSGLPSGTEAFAKFRLDIHNTELKIMEHHLNEMTHGLNFCEKTRCEFQVREGNVVKEVIKEAYATDADLLMVGTHGATGLKDILFGTHTWEIIKRSSIPVLAVPEHIVFDGIRKIVFATKYTAGEMSSLDHAVRLASRFNARLLVLHVADHTFSMQSNLQRFEKFCKEVRSRVEYDNLTIDLIPHADIFTGLNEFCERAKPDLIMLSPEHRSFLKKVFLPRKSVTREMSTHSAIPLMVMPDISPEETLGIADRIEKDN